MENNTIAKMRVALFRVLIAAAMSVVVVSESRATAITYDFSVTATSGPFSGQSSSGSFSYDSSSITPGATNGTTGLLTTLDFTWGGIAYSAATANTGYLSFDASGNLSDFLFGTNCIAGGCGVGTADEGWALSPSGFLATFIYSHPPSEDLGLGDLTYQLATGVPEPVTIPLFGAGLAGVAAMRRRRRELSAS